MSDPMASDGATESPTTPSIDRDTTRTRLVAGVSALDTPLITAAIEYAQRLSEPYLFNHAMRSWLFAELIGRVKGIEFDREVVAMGTILHDIGLTSAVSGPHRFEVNGADAALAFIRARGVSDRSCSADLGPGGPQLDAIPRDPQGGRGGGGHDGHRARLRRLRPGRRSLQAISTAFSLHSPACG